jgi:hypothetical protein
MSKEHSGVCHLDASEVIKDAELRLALAGATMACQNLGAVIDGLCRYKAEPSLCALACKPSLACGFCKFHALFRPLRFGNGMQRIHDDIAALTIALCAGCLAAQLENQLVTRDKDKDKGKGRGKFTHAMRLEKL